MDFQIEKNVPIRPRYRNRIAPWEQLASEMAVGDSRLVPRIGKTRGAQSLLHSALRKLGMKATSRQEGDMIRTWRIG